MTDTKDPVTRADIESKLREIKDDVETTTTTAKPYVAVAVAVAAVTLVGIAFVLGRRRGTKLSTVVEVRRV
ncbi:MAG: hypothetical protein M3396_08085 [Actinomycetota bacterium]|nr:hypothetical protein [Actinomycetota bacterium]MDQ3574787.1 hypothetical protein [Actinomycetota bacterium]